MNKNLLKPNRFLFYLAVEILVVLIVTMLFRIFSENIKLAAVLAGSLFCTFPVVLLLLEYRISKAQFKIWIFSLLFFLIFFAIPMLAMRLLHWNEDFQSIQIWGLPGPAFHKLSRWGFIAVLSTTMVAILQENRLPKKS